MSFTVRVKEELLSLKRFEKSELAAIIKMSGSLGISTGGLTLSVTTENAKIARHIYELLLHFYGAKIRYSPSPKDKFTEKSGLYGFLG